MLVDRTGLPGPRTWSNQSFPEGKADHPVTDVTWYEADAYAAFRGKQLADDLSVGEGGTQRLSAGRPAWPPCRGVRSIRAIRSRIARTSAPARWPATSAAFGMSAFGAYNMAGNVAEWTSNDSSDGFLATGGAWGDPTYTFSQFGGRPGFFSSEKLGFRCARTAAESAGDQGGMRIELDQEVPHYTAPSPQEFATLASAYRYEKTPLDARIEQTIDTPEWKRERITFNGANGARAIAYLYLPNHAPRPLQVMHYLPAGDVDSGFRSLPDCDGRPHGAVRQRRARRVWRRARRVYRASQARGLRPSRSRRPSSSRTWSSSRVTDLRRGLDYLETRTDIDMTRIARARAERGLRPRADSRRRSKPATARSCSSAPGSLRLPVDQRRPPTRSISRRTFARRSWSCRDATTRTRRFEPQTEPFFKLLSEPKRLMLYDGGHVPSIEVSMSTTSPWLEEQLGRVVR